MKVLILAAGRGSRMEHMTDDKPKCLLKIQNKTLLSRLINNFHKIGITEIGIITGYKRELLNQYGLHEFHNPNWDHTNMVQSLQSAKEWLKSTPCIVSYSDIFYDHSAITSLVQTDATLAITYAKNWLDLWSKRFEDPLSDAESFKLNEDHSLKEIGQKAQHVDEIEGQYMGLLKITPDSFKEMTHILKLLPVREKNQLHMTGLLQKILERERIKIMTIPYDKDWGEVDSIEDLKVYET